MPPAPSLLGKAPRKYWSANALAFLGDAVWELYIRRSFFCPPKRLSDYHGLVKENARAEQQEVFFQKLVDSADLSEEELDVLRWGRNATGVVPKRIAAGGQLKRDTYRSATALECLVGLLYLTDAGRLHELMVHLGLAVEEEDAGEG